MIIRREEDKMTQNNNVIERGCEFDYVKQKKSDEICFSESGQVKKRLRYTELCIF